MEIEERISQRVIALTGKPLEYYKGKQRDRMSVIIRKCIFYSMRKNGFTYKRIGEMFNRDHSTVVHGISSVEDWIGYPASFKEETYILKSVLGIHVGPVEMIKNLDSFVQLTLANGKAFYDFSTGELFTSLNKFSQCSEQNFIPIKLFNVQSLLRKDRIVLNNQKLIDSGMIVLMGEILGDNVEVKLVKS